MNILLVNPNIRCLYPVAQFQSASDLSAVPLGLLCLAAPLLQEGHKVKLLDLNLTSHQLVTLENTLRQFKPDCVGITSSTPIIYEAYRVAGQIKKFNGYIPIVLGGAHASAMEWDALAPEFDHIVKGEGDYALGHILIERENGSYTPVLKQNPTGDLDSLPLPAYELLEDITKYTLSRFLCRKNPVAYLETSRGCYGKCTFCDRGVQGRKVRFKSADRVLDEMEYLLGLGYQEIQIIDDMFIADTKRAYAICDLILQRGLKFPWYPRSGVRVDKASLDLFKIMKRAGCYRIPFGVESGSQRILDSIKKEITLEQIKNAVRWAKKAGLETECFFIVGLPGETEEDLQATINFAVALNPDFAKPPQVALPTPGTEMTKKMEDNGQIKSKDWRKYHYLGNCKEIYDHDTLSWDTIDRSLKLFNRKYYFRLRYILKRGCNTLLSGKWLAHVKSLRGSVAKWFRNGELVESKSYS
jgi:radical SAM superfamily enzyme YgiQ (UPF0313 family)